MKNFTSVNDVKNVQELIEKVLSIKGTRELNFGQGKNLSMFFFNPSLRTRLSTEIAASNLGMHVTTMNLNQGWNLEHEKGAIMNKENQEHIFDAVKVMSSYSDVIGLRSFANLKNKKEDFDDSILKSFILNSSVPVISLESALRHPLQSLTDIVTITEFKIKRPKIAVSWAPHPKILPQAVVNSFLEWIQFLDAEIVLTHPKGYELDDNFAKNIKQTYNQQEALTDADFVYVKNWGTVNPYGLNLGGNEDWIITEEKMKLTKNGKFMHCLPIRRNVIATDNVIDQSIVYEQAANRVWAAQTVLKELLKG